MSLAYIGILQLTETPENPEGGGRERTEAEMNGEFPKTSPSFDFTDTLIKQLLKESVKWNKRISSYFTSGE